MRRWSDLAERVAATTRTSEKTALLADYLRSLTPDELPVAAVFLTGRPFPEADQRSAGLGWSAIMTAIGQVAAVTREDLGQAYDRLEYLHEHRGQILGVPTHGFDFDVQFCVDPVDNGGPITLKQLATHHSGLSRLPGNLTPKDRWNPYADYTADKLATDVSIVDVSERLAITDAFVLASATNERQVKAIVDEVEEKLREAVVLEAEAAERMAVAERRLQELADR